MNIAATAILFVTLLGLGSVVACDARESTTKGWMFGLDFGAAGTSFEHARMDRGPLVGGRVGYGLSPMFTPYIAAYEADIDVRNYDAFDKLTFGHIDLGLRMHWVDRERRWVPYGDLAFTYWPVSDVFKNGEQTTTDFTGVPTWSLGGGLAFYLSETWAVDVNVKVGKSEFRDVELDNIALGGQAQHTHTFLDIAAESVRLTVGASWWP